MLSPLEIQILRKIESAGTPLKDWDVSIYRGILTGFNDAFIIDEETQKRLTENSPESAEIIRPILRGRDVKKYRATNPNLWIIFTRRGIDLEKYPAIEKHLSQYRTELTPKLSGDKIGRKPGTYKWHEIQDNVAYYKDFDKEKVVWIELTDQPKFALDTEGYYLNNTIFFMTGDYLRYLIGFLNSSLCEWYFDKLAATSGAGTRRWIKMYIDQIRVPQVSEAVQAPIVVLVDEASQPDTTEQRRSEIKPLLDKEVFRLFGLSQEEMAFIEANHSVD